MSKKTTNQTATEAATQNQTDTAPADTFKIEKGVPVPEITSARRTKYPWADMVAGDSFFIEGKSVNNMTQSARKWAKTHSPDAKFVARKVTENGKEGVRTWRTE